jgi:hypothetical protein
MKTFVGLQLKGVGAPPQVVVIDGAPYVVIIRPIPGLQGQGVNLECGLVPWPEETNVAEQDTVPLV